MYLHPSVCACTFAHGDQTRMLVVHILKLELKTVMSYWIEVLGTDTYLLGAYIFIRKLSFLPEDHFLIKI